MLAKLQKAVALLVCKQYQQFPFANWNLGELRQHVVPWDTGKRGKPISNEFVSDVFVKYGCSVAFLCALAEIHLRTPVTAAGILPPHHYTYHPVPRCNYYIQRAEPLGQICAQTGSTGQIKNYSDTWEMSLWRCLSFSKLQTLIPLYTITDTTS